MTLLSIPLWWPESYPIHQLDTIIACGIIGFGLSGMSIKAEKQTG